MSTSETVFRLAALACFLTAILISFYYRIKAQRVGGDRLDRRQEGWLLPVLRLGGLALWGAVIAYLINPGWMAWGQLELPAWSRWAGAAGCLTGIALTAWMFRSLGNNITDTVVTRREHTLVTNGPYRWIRHPLYTFATFTYLNLSLLMASWFTAVMILLAFGLLALRTQKEEQQLLDRFGESYREYMRRTGRFLPRLSGGPTKLAMER